MILPINRNGVLMRELMRRIEARTAAELNGQARRQKIIFVVELVVAILAISGALAWFVFVMILTDPTW